MAKTIRMKKKCKKADNQSEEALQIAEKRETKGKIHPTESRVLENNKEIRRPS